MDDFTLKKRRGEAIVCGLCVLLVLAALRIVVAFRTLDRFYQTYRMQCAHCCTTPSDMYEGKVSDGNAIDGAYPSIKFHGVGRT